MAKIEVAHRECAASIGKPNGDASGAVVPVGAITAPCAVCGESVWIERMDFVALVTGTPGFDRVRARWEEDHRTKKAPEAEPEPTTLGDIETGLGALREEMVTASQAQDLALERELTKRYDALCKAEQDELKRMQNAAQDDGREDDHVDG